MYIHSAVRRPCSPDLPSVLYLFVCFFLKMPGQSQLVHQNQEYLNNFKDKVSHGGIFCNVAGKGIKMHDEARKSQMENKSTF